MSLTVTDYGLGIFNFLSPSQTIAQSAWTLSGPPTSLEIDATTTLSGGYALKLSYTGNFNVSSIPSSAKTLADIPFFTQPSTTSSVSGQAWFPIEARSMGSTRWRRRCPRPAWSAATATDTR